MAFSQDDLDSLAADFRSARESQIVTPRAFERRTGGNAGFSHFNRAAPKPSPVVPMKRCRRCKQDAEPNRVLCQRHAEQHRRWATERHRRRGVQPWQPGGLGRPPRLAQKSVDLTVAIEEALLADALIQLAAMQRRVTDLRRAVTVAKKQARAALRKD